MSRLLQILLLLLVTSELRAQPAANFTATPRSGCAPMVVTFTSTSTGSPTTYSWNFGNGITSTAANPVVPYTVAGVYTVSLTVGSSTGSNTKTQTGYITVNQVPAVSLSATPLIVCPGSPVNFSSNVAWNASGTGTYTWDFGDGGTASTSSPIHSYTNGGTYTVKLTGVNSVNCPRTDTQTNLIFVYPRPKASFDASDTAVCSSSGGSTTFTAVPSAGTAPYSYSWDFGDGSTGSGSPVTHSYSTVGTYSVKLSFTDANGCTDSLIRTNYIRRRNVSAGFTAPASACVGASVTATNTTGSTLGPMTFNFGDGTAAKTGISVTHNYTTAGTYTITQTASEGGCSQTTTQTIIIRPQPNSAFAFTPAQPCPAPQQIQFNAASVVPGNTYSWDFGDGFNGVGSSPAHYYPKDSLYTVKLGVTDANGCSSTTSRQLPIYPMRGGMLVDQRTGCGPLRVEFDFLLQSADTSGKVMGYPYPVSSINWNFGDGTSTTGAKPVHIYTTIGQFLATATLTTSNGCVMVDTMRIYVGIKPVSNFGVSTRVVCVGVPVNFTDSSTSTTLAVNSWVYDVGDGTLLYGPNQSYKYTTPGVYTVSLAAGINGCYDTLVKLNYVVVNFPKASMRVRTNCVTPLQVSFADSSLGATGHVWIFGDGTTSTAAHPVHTYPAPGNYTAMLAVVNSTTGCVDTIGWALNLNPLVPNFTANRTTLCKGEIVDLHASATGGGIPRSYSWWVGTGITPSFLTLSEFPDMSMSMRNPGLYNVAVEIIDQNGCAWHFQRNNYILVGGPNVAFSAAPPIACLPYGRVTFTDNSTHPTGVSGASRTWDFGDGSPPVTSTAGTISHTYVTPASYGIILKVTDNIGCTDSAKVPNYLNVSDPSAIWSTTSPRACENAPFYFFNSSNGNGLTYNWSFGDGGSSTQANPMYVYKSVGTYTVRLIVTDNIGCKDTLARVAHVTVNSRPVAAFSLSDTLKICSPMIINFTDRSSGAVRWNWSFGTGANSILQNPSATYTTPKIYNIRLVATNAAGCNDTAFRSARLLGYAGVLSYSPLTGCAPLTVNFRANDVDLVPGFIYNFGDGTSGATTGKTMTHTYTKPGTYIPSLTMTDNLGCIAASSGIDEIKVDGVISGFTFSPFPACDHGTIRFIDTSRGAFGAIDPPIWSFHDGTRSTDRSPEKTYAGPGSFNVVLYHTTATGCRDTLRSQVVFHKLPQIDAGIDTTICRSDTATLRPRGGVSYEWSPAGSLSCAECRNPGAFPTVQTRYTVTGTDTNGCKNTDTVTIRVRLKVDAAPSPDMEICSGKTATLSITGGGDYEWSPPTSLHNPTGSTTVAYPMTTTRYIVISRLSSCIPDTDYVNVTVHQTPTVDAGKSRVIIAGETTPLEGVGTGPISTWLWTPPDGLSCETCYNPESSPKRSTRYTVSVSSDFGCTATDTVRVSVLCDQSQVFLPNTFTPEGNGVNDIFYPRGKGIQTIGRFRIYNRWGEVVFERNNMAVDDRSQGWDGRKDGRLLSPDVYVYTVEATCDTGEPIKWQGDILLLR